MRKTIDSIRLFDESRNLHPTAAVARATLKKSPAPLTRIVEKQGAFYGCVHRPLSGVGVFFVALV
jgi:hypothetical protein